MTSIAYIELPNNTKIPLIKGQNKIIPILQCGNTVIKISKCEYRDDIAERIFENGSKQYINGEWDAVLDKYGIDIEHIINVLIKIK